MPTIGIDAIALAVPEGYLDLADLADARGVPAGKYRRRPRRPAHGGRAPARGSGRARRRRRRAALFATADVDPSTIGLCVVGTETAVDHSKPVAAYLHRLLGLPQQCRVFEAKHACFGGTAGLLAALDWIASRLGARTQGAHRLHRHRALRPRDAGRADAGRRRRRACWSRRTRASLALEVGVTGSYAQDVNDFWRPLYRKEAVVDGHHSVQCYLDALAGAYQGVAGGVAGDGPRRQARAPLLPRALRQDGEEGAPPRHALEGASEAEADASYAAEVASSLRLPSQVGNIYTGSLYLALASLLEAEAARARGPAHRPLQLRLGLLRRVLRRPRRRAARARSPTRSSWPRRSRIAASTPSPSTSRSACATKRATSARSTARPTSCPRAPSPSSASTPTAASTSPEPSSSPPVRPSAARGPAHQRAAGALRSGDAAAAAPRDLAGC